MSYVPLIDVSHHQGIISWGQVANSDVHALGKVRGAYLKATEGTNYRDKTLDDNWIAAKHVNLHVGAYHFARPSGENVSSDARGECEHFVRTIRSLYDETRRVLPPMLDLEVTQLGPALTSDWMDYFLKDLEDRMGIAPIIYTGAYTPFENRPFFNRYSLWMARYPKGYEPHPDPEDLKPADTRPFWPAWDVWQYTSSGTVGGIKGAVDLNVARRSWFDRVTGTVTEPAKPVPVPQDPTKDEMAEGLYIRNSKDQYAFTDGASTTVLTPAIAVRQHRDLFDPEKKLPMSVLVSDDLWGALIAGRG